MLVEFKGPRLDMTMPESRKTERVEWIKDGVLVREHRYFTEINLDEGWAMAYVVPHNGAVEKVHGIFRVFLEGEVT